MELRSKPKGNRIPVRRNVNQVPAAIHLIPDLSPMCQLPNEILAIVLNKLTQDEVLRLRRVDKYWKSKVDSLYSNWTIPLNDNCPYLNWLVNLHVKEVRIQKLLKPLQSRPQGKILEYPDQLQKITQNSNNYPEKPVISSENLATLLQSKNIKSVYFPLEKSMDNIVPHDFSKIVEFEVKLYNIADIGEKQNQLFEKLLLNGNSQFPKLQHFGLFTTHDEKSSSGEDSDIQKRLKSTCQTLLSFLVQNAQNLISFQHCHSGRIAKLASLPMLNLNELHQLQLQKLSLTLQPGLIFTDISNQLLNCQNGLLELEMGSTTEASPVRITLIRQVLSNNAASLTSVMISGITGSGFNMAIFKACLSLKKLDLYTLSQIKDQFLFNELRLLSTNLSTLPDTLESLGIQGFGFSPSDIEKFLESHTALTELFCICGAASGTTGFNSYCLQQILEHPALEQVVFLGSCVPYAGPDTFERSKLSEIFKPLGLDLEFKNIKFRSYFLDNFALTRDLAKGQTEFSATKYTHVKTNKRDRQPFGWKEKSGVFKKFMGCLQHLFQTENDRL